MYVTGREIIPTQGRLQDAMAFVTTMTGSMNEKFNSNLAVSMEVGGNPNKLWITAFWATLDDYQSFVEGYSADPTLQVGFNVADSVVAEAQDQIGQVMRAPGERKQFAQMNTGRIRHTRYAEGIEFAMNAGELISSIAGTELGIVTPITGDLYDINFVWYADSLQGLKDLQDKLNASEEYQELFANGSELFESKYESNIVMMVS